MKSMRRLILIFIFIVAGISLSYPLYLSKTTSPCDEPQPYRIGSIDERFGYSREEFLGSVNQAASIWNSTGRNLLTFDETALLSINLVYDERQSSLSIIQNLEESASQNKNAVEKEGRDFESRVSDFRQRAAKLNTQIEYWDSQGGAPPGIYERLVKEQDELAAEANRLNDEAGRLNRKLQEFSSEVINLNRQISRFNKLLHDKPEGGIYKPDTNTIEIYLADNQEELVRITAHEMGHALGIGHVADKNSIMYPLSSTAQNLSNDDLWALENICQGAENWEIIIDSFRSNLWQFLSKDGLN